MTAYGQNINVTEEISQRKYITWPLFSCLPSAENCLPQTSRRLNGASPRGVNYKTQDAPEQRETQSMDVPTRGLMGNVVLV